MNLQLEENLATVIESFNGPVCAIDPHFKLLSFNTLLKDLLKKIFQVEINVGYDFSFFENVLAPEDILFIKKCFGEALQGKRLRVAKEFNYGEYHVHWEFSVNPVFVANKVVALICFATDITAQKETERKLKEIQERLKLVSENSVFGIVWGNLEGKLIDANTTFCQILEAPLEELLNTNYEEFTFPDDVPKEKALVKKLFKREIDSYQIEKRYVTKSKKIKWVRLNISFAKNANSEIQYVIGIVQEIEERKKAEQLLFQSEANLKTILDHTGAGYLLLDTKFNVSAFNKIANNWVMQEFALELVNEKNALTVIPKMYHSLMTQILEDVISGSPYHYTGKYILESGKTEWYVVNMVRVLNPQKEVSGVVIAVSDVTREKNSEEEIKLLNESLEQSVKARTQQLQASTSELEAFTYSVSHDLRAPLRNINGFAEILLEDNDANLTEGMKKHLEVIKQNSTRMGQLIDSLLEMSRLGRSHIVPKEVNMKQLVIEVIEEIKFADKNFRTEIVLQNLHPVHGDFSLLKQVWQNLISNAIKYSSGKENPRIEIGSSHGDKRVNYFIKDNGVGFDMQYSHKLFGVFQRLHKDSEFSGTGVGLAIVKRIIQKHNGQVGVDSKLNEGTTFYFNLPA